MKLVAPRNGEGARPEFPVIAGVEFGHAIGLRRVRSADEEGVSMKTKVYYADTDAGGVVYYANYLRWLEMARADWLEQWGISLAEYVQRGIVFAVRRVEIDYREPAILGDHVEVTVAPHDVRRVRFTLQQNVIRSNDQVQLATARVTLACLTPTGKITTVPPELAETMRRWFSETERQTL